MNRLAVYSYLTRYPYGHTGPGRLFTEPLPDNDFFSPCQQLRVENQFGVSVHVSLLAIFLSRIL